jgi:protein SCO1/2
VTAEERTAGSSPNPIRTAVTLVVLATIVLGALIVWRLGRDEVGTAVASDDGWRGDLLVDPWERPDFTLTDTEGAPFDFRAETEGRLTLLFFGYTSCPDICPIHMATLAEALDRPSMPDPVVVFVGIDTERDTPDAVRTFLDQFDPTFIGLTGTDAEIEAAQEATGVPVGYAAPNGEGSSLVGHAAQVTLYTSDDLAHLAYPFGTRQDDWATDLPRVQRNDEWSS